MSDVCQKCGWYIAPFSSAHDGCEVKGAHAKALRDALPEHKLTQLGYGFGAVVADLSDRLHVRFETYRDGRERGAQPFALREVWSLDSLSVDDAEDLVRTIEAWRLRCAARRKS